MSEARAGANVALPCALPARSDHLNVEVADLLAQRVAVDAEQVGSANLVAPRRGERRRHEGKLDLLQDPMVKAGRRYAVFEPREIAGQVALDRGAERFFRARLLARRRKGRLRE